MRALLSMTFLQERFYEKLGIDFLLIIGSTENLAIFTILQVILR